MNISLFLGKTLLVADRCYHPLLFKLKNEHPELDIKIITRSELVDKLSFKYVKDPLPFLIVDLHEEYSKAKKYMELIHVSDVSKNSKLSNYYSQLKNNGYIQEDKLGLFELKRFSNILLFNIKDDQEIKSLLSRKGFSYSDLSFKDLYDEEFINQSKESLKNKVCYFDNKFLQFFYIFSDIKKKLSEDESLKDRINIQISDGAADIYYLKLCSKLFGIDVYVNVQSPLITDREVKSQIEQIYKTQSLEFEVPEDSKFLNVLSNLIKQYRLKELDNFEEAYSNLLEIVNSIDISSPLSNKGITATSKINFIPGEVTYVTNFQHKDFYKEYADDNVLTDAELEEVKSNPSYIKTLLDKQKKEAFILYNDIVMLSRVKQHLTDNIFDSQFLSDFTYGTGEFDKDGNEILVELKKFVKHLKYNESGLYTSEALEMLNCDIFDKAFQHKEYEKNLSNPYDHSFKGFKGEVKATNDKGNYSITNLESYIACPFKFYLSKALPLKEDDYHSRWRGTMLHKMLETVYHKEFDIEYAINEGKKLYVQSVNDEHQEFTPKEEAYMEIIEYWARRVLPLIRKQVEDEFGMNIDSFNDDAEIGIGFDLFDPVTGNKYHFGGKIDKLVLTSTDTSKFYTIVDYKTGSERFYPEFVFLGASTQIPMYYYALNECRPDLIKDYKFGGAGIKPSFGASIKKIFQDNDHYLSLETAIKNLRFVGLTTTNVEYWKSFDPTGLKEKDDTLKASGGTYVQRTNDFTTVDADEVIVEKSNLKKYNFLDLVEDAKQATLETIRKILNNDFKIAPSSTNLRKIDTQHIACRYCKYGDICYHKFDDAVNYYDEISAHFYKNEDEEESNNEEEQLGGEA